jgi:uncharacterized protein (UPF0332 family)
MNREQELIAYRRTKAKETLQDGKILFDAKRLPSAVNRIYYSLFYEVTALFLTKDLSSSKHSGVMSLFNEHFVKSGQVTVELAIPCSSLQGHLDRGKSLRNRRLLK